MRFRTYFASERRKPTVLSHLYAGRNHMTRNLRIISQPDGGLSPSFPKAFQRIRDLSRTRLVIMRAGWWDLLTAGPAIIQVFRVSSHFHSWSLPGMSLLTIGTPTYKPLCSWCVTTQCGLPLRYSYFWHIEVNYSSPFPAIQASLSQLVYFRQVLQFLKGDWRGSNPRSLEPQSTALPTKLQPPYARQQDIVPVRYPLTFVPTFVCQKLLRQP